MGVRIDFPGARLLRTAACVIGASWACAAADANAMHLVVALKPRDPRGLAALATAVSTPGTPEYRHYLTVRTFARRFGASPAAVRAVRSALSARDLRVRRVTANRLSIDVDGGRAQVQRALSVSLRRFKAADGRLAWRSRRAPALPRTLARYVQGVIGLDGGAIPRSSALTSAGPRSPPRPPAPTRHASAVGPQPCQDALSFQQVRAQSSFTVYTAPQIAAAYDLQAMYAAHANGAGQTVAVLGLSTYAPSDVATYQQCYGLTQTVSTVPVTGSPTATPIPEVALDVEQIAGLAPNANILIYQAPDNESGLLAALQRAVSDNTAKVISLSYGECEPIAAPVMVNGHPLISSENVVLMEAATQGQTFVADSGDFGSSGCYSSNPANTAANVDDPASQPFATAVGATTLLSPTHSPSESVWAEGTPPNVNGSGGGVSSQWQMPSYQSGAAAPLGVVNPLSSKVPCGGTTDCREVPDVSADGDPSSGYDLYLNGAWGTGGGTSASAPVLAAFAALVDSSPPCRGVPVGFLNPALYRIASTAYAQNFVDVTKPNSFSGDATTDLFDPSGGLYPVGPGYDMTTGLGSPIGATLARSLCAAQSPVYTVAVPGTATQRSTIGRHVSLPIRATDSGGVQLIYSAVGLPPGLAINGSTGVISGVPTRTQSSLVTVTVADPDFNSSSTTFSWTVVAGLPAVSRGRLTGLTGRHPTLRFTIAAGAGAGDVTLVLVMLPKGLRFSKSAAALRRGIAVKSARKTVLRTYKGALNVAFKPSVERATISVSAPALTVSRSLAAAVRAHKVKRLVVGLGVLDPVNVVTSKRLKLAVH
jgi:hypothetical protein